MTPSRPAAGGGDRVAGTFVDLLLVAASLAGREADLSLNGGESDLSHAAGSLDVRPGPKPPGARISWVESAFRPARRRLVPDRDLRVTRPWQGPLFDIVSRVAAGGSPGRRPRLGLLVPVVWAGSAPVPDIVVVGDHVDLALRAPLAGRRPDGGRQVFPSLTGIYQPPPGAFGEESRVYSEVAVAGVGDVRRLTPFERRQLEECGCTAYCDCLVDAVVVAAFHGVEVVACGVPQATIGD